jgi:hypothetical protein
VGTRKLLNTITKRKFPHLLGIATAIEKPQPITELVKHGSLQLAFSTFNYLIMRKLNKIGNSLKLCFKSWFIKSSNTGFIRSNISKFCSYLIGNALHLRYKDQ